jgi:DNA-binding CsgD family transcriptional regulator
MELLAYLPSRLTFADIAAHSFVSINTVKTHIGHIYRKLGVTGRDEAIERAAQLGLIDANQIARVG